MSEFAIRAHGLGKDYAVGSRRGNNLREAVMDAVRSPLRTLKGTFARPEIVQVLKDISFDIREGEVVGIIGRNGAGKSTLLKLLARITEPSRGRAEIRGRLSALLEVGTGFHSELTGRENIFMNGAILGMRRHEIARHFDEIVAFAGVEKFIDTQVKHYSSGMYMRLAFAVAAHLEPEILLVDEVLAVGDANFQRRCIGRMKDVADHGRTVLVVSHNMQSVRSLTTRGIVIDSGKVRYDGPTEGALLSYIDVLRNAEPLEERAVNNRRGRTSGAAVFSKLTIGTPSTEEQWTFNQGDTIRFRFEVRVHQRVAGLALYIAIRSGLTNEVVTTIKDVLTSETLDAGFVGTAIVDLPDVSLRASEYSLYIALSDAKFEASPMFDVLDGNVSLPFVTIVSDDTDMHRSFGVFSIPYRQTFGEAPGGSGVTDAPARSGAHAEERT